LIINYLIKTINQNLDLNLFYFRLQKVFKSKLWKMNVQEKSSTNLLRLNKVFEFSAKNKTKIFDIFIQNLITFSKFFSNIS